MGWRKNQLASSSAEESLVSHNINLTRFPAYKCKHLSMYMHTKNVQSAVTKELSSIQ